jgi:CarboxypepD_reg-like domain/TonB-dependent Receptor Plug Domain
MVFFKNCKRILPIAFAVLVAFTMQAQNNGRISGIVVDKLTQKTLANASVSIEGTSKGAITDTNGVFRVTGIPLKTYNIVFSLVGYKKQTLFNVVINAGNENNFSIELEQNADALAEVVVKTNKRTVRAATLETPLSVQRLTTEEIKSNPGGNFDISKVIQTLPGVGGGAGGGGFRNDIIIRGGGPGENVFYLDGIEVPVINHFQRRAVPVGHRVF